MAAKGKIVLVRVLGWILFIPNALFALVFIIGLFIDFDLISVIITVVFAGVSFVGFMLARYGRKKLPAPVPAVQLETKNKPIAPAEYKPPLEEAKNHIGNMPSSVWVDVETTGLDPSNSGAFEIAMLIYKESKCVFEDIYHLNPLNNEIKWSHGAYKVNGVKKETILSYPPLEEVMPRIAEDLKKHMPPEKHVFAGYNCAFDYRHIDALFARIGLRATDFFSNERIDVLQSVKQAADKGLLPYTENKKLTTMAEAMGIPHEGAHSALSDIRVTRKLYEAIAEIQQNKMSKRADANYIPKEQVSSRKKAILKPVDYSPLVELLFETQTQNENDFFPFDETIAVEIDYCDGNGKITHRKVDIKYIAKDKHKDGYIFSGFYHPQIGGQTSFAFSQVQKNLVDGQEIDLLRYIVDIYRQSSQYRATMQALKFKSDSEMGIAARILAYIARINGTFSSKKKAAVATYLQRITDVENGTEIKDYINGLKLLEPTSREEYKGLVEKADVSQSLVDVALSIVDKDIVQLEDFGMLLAVLDKKKNKEAI